MKFLIALVLALAVVLGTANAASTKCRSPKKNFHIANGESIGYGNGSSPDACRKSCEKKNKNGVLVCGSYEFAASRFGSGCELYEPGAKLKKGSDCSSPGSCTKYANICGNNKQPVVY